jgi:L,D-transpeptidase catalytic domain
VRRFLPLVFLVVLASAAPAAGAEVLPPGEPIAHGSTLSDERELTRWAHVYVPGKIKSRPSTKGRTVSRLRFQTEDGLPEVYPVLSARETENGRMWIRIRVPGRPNGRTGWVLRSHLSPFKLVRTRLVLNRRTLRMTLFKSGKSIWTTRVGIGKASTPTPAGDYWIRERLKNLGGSPVYGPYAFGTAAYSGLSEWPGGGVIGIHGTNQPELIPGRPSHGCIRVPNAKILRLVKLMPIGTPLKIR